MSRVSRLLLALLALLAIGGCRTAAIYRPAVAMRLAVEPAEVRAGGSVGFEMAVTNPRPDTLVLEFDDDCRVTFLVLDADQRPGGPQGTVALCVEPGKGSLVLPAGATWRARETWTASTPGGEPVPAGAYVVRAVLGEHVSVYRGRRDFKMGHAADTVVVRVVP